MKLQDYLTTAISYVIKPSKRKLIRLSRKRASQRGLEIGGPSAFFKVKSYFPVYVFAEQVDGVNFSNETVWEGQITEGYNYKYYDDKKGQQYIGEASELKNVPSGEYDFVLSCHSLEHVANPIKALKEWNRVLKNNGHLALVLPDKEFTFDDKRPYTTFEHLVGDYNSNITEDDRTHFAEVLALHDLKKDTGVTSFHELKERTENNFENRCVHHHVFSLEVIKKMLEYAGFKVIHQQKATPFHLVTFAQKNI